MYPLVLRRHTEMLHACDGTKPSIKPRRIRFLTNQQIRTSFPALLPSCRPPRERTSPDPPSKHSCLPLLRETPLSLNTSAQTHKSQLIITRPLIRPKSSIRPSFAPNQQLQPPFPTKTSARRFFHPPTNPLNPIPYRRAFSTTRLWALAASRPQASSDRYTHTF
jgi:hypothetical protein